MAKARTWIDNWKLHVTYGLKFFRNSLPTFSFCVGFYILGTLLIWRFYSKESRSLIKSALYMYFLMLAEPIFPEAPEHWVVDLITIISPLLGIIFVFDLITRFSFHVFSKRTKQRGWVTVVASTYSDHIVLCGLGRVGEKVFEELLALGESIVCVEMRETARGVATARASGHPVLIDDARHDQVLLDAGVERAKAVLAMTDDDMVNLEIVLDVRKYNKDARLISRVFEPELGQKIGEAFELDGVFSTATVSAPFFAVSCLDPEIVSSYYAGQRLFVVVQTKVREGDKLCGSSIHKAYEEHGVTIVARGWSEDLNETLEPDYVLTVGENITFHCAYADLKLYRG